MPRPLRVCLVVNSLSYGGAENLLVDLVEAAEEASFHLVYFGGDDSLATDLDAAGATVRALGERFRFDPLAGYRLVRYLRQRRFDVLHLHLPYTQTVGRIAAALADVPAVVSTQHNVPSNYHPVTRWTERATRPLDDVTVAVSQGVERAFTGCAHEPGEFGDDWCTICNGIDVTGFRRSVEDADAEGLRERLGISSRERTFLNVGRYVADKSQRDLVRGFATADVPDSHLVVVGHGPLADDLRLAASETGVEERVHVTGRVSEVEPYYALADGFVSSSRVEGMPITLLEAMAASLPVIATDIPGVREVVVEDETGYLYPFGDTERLASRLETVVTDDRLRRLGRAGFDRAERLFDVERMAEAYLRLYREVSEIKAGPGEQ